MEEEYLRSELVNLVSTTFEILSPALKSLSFVSSQSFSENFNALTDILILVACLFMSCYCKEKMYTDQFSK